MCLAFRGLPTLAAIEMCGPSGLQTFGKCWHSLLCGVFVCLNVILRCLRTAGSLSFSWLLCPPYTCGRCLLALLGCSEDLGECHRSISGPLGLALSYVIFILKLLPPILLCMGVGRKYYFSISWGIPWCEAHVPSPPNIPNIPNRPGLCLISLSTSIPLTPGR